MSQPEDAISTPSVIHVHDFGHGTEPNPFRDSSAPASGLRPSWQAWQDGLLHEEIYDSIKDVEATGRSYLPLSAFNRILGKDAIDSLVQWRRIKGDNEDLSDANEVYAKCRRIIATLLYMNKTKRLIDFVKNGIDDDDLPLSLVGDESLGMISTRTSEHIKSTLFEGSLWRRRDMEKFLKYQGIFFVPFFDIKDGMLRHYEFPDGIQLPWLKCEEKEEGLGLTTSKLEIDPDHHNFQCSNTPGRPVSFTLREIDTSEWKVQLDELAALQQAHVTLRGEQHLAELLFTYRQESKLCFVSRWVDESLVEFWQSRRHSRTSAEMSEWIAVQCLGLAEAVRSIHELPTWRRDKTPVFGSHGSIRPDNILCSAAGFVLSDLGTTRVENSIANASPYRAPEAESESCQEFKNQFWPRYDIWSLGVVFLSLCSWLLRGRFAVKACERALAENLRSRSVDVGEMVSALRHWIEKLFIWAGAGRNPFVTGLLLVIQRDMLVVSKNKRKSAAEVCTAIGDMIDGVRGIENERRQRERDGHRAGSAQPTRQETRSDEQAFPAQVIEEHRSRGAYLSWARLRIFRTTVGMAFGRGK